MLARNGAILEIDSVYSRAICDEIGDRLRQMLRREIKGELAPRLRHLMEQFADADREIAPVIVPSLEDMIALRKPAAATDETTASAMLEHPLA
jgi:hypothetical protein